MIINGSALLKAAPIRGMTSLKQRYKGMSWGLTECGYDIRIGEDVWLFPGRRAVLTHSVEYFQMPQNMMGRVLNKSSWVRRGVDASRVTNIEPGWRGYLTIELVYSKLRPIFIPAGVGIAQVIFEDLACNAQYDGKYQDQPARAVKAR